MDVFALLLILLSAGEVATAESRTPACCIEINSGRIIGIQADSTDYWFNEGNKLYTRGEYDKAIKAYDNATNLDPQYADAWNNKGEVLILINRQSEAIKCFDKAIEINPYNYIPWYYRAIALSDGGVNDIISPAVFRLNPKLFYGDELDVAAKLNSDLENSACYWYYKGKEYNKCGDQNMGAASNSCYNEAIQAFDNALKINPNLMQAWWGKAYALHEMGMDYSEAYNKASGSRIPEEYRVFS